MSGTTIEADTSTAPPFALPNIEPIPEVIPVTRDTPYHREETPTTRGTRSLGTPSPMQTPASDSARAATSIPPSSSRRLTRQGERTLADLTQPSAAPTTAQDDLTNENQASSSATVDGLAIVVESPAATPSTPRKRETIESLRQKVDVSITEIAAKVDHYHNDVKSDVALIQKSITMLAKDISPISAHLGIVEKIIENNNLLAKSIKTLDNNCTQALSAAKENRIRLDDMDMQLSRLTQRYSGDAEGVLSPAPKRSQNEYDSGSTLIHVPCAHSPIFHHSNRSSTPAPPPPRAPAPPPPRAPTLPPSGSNGRMNDQNRRSHSDYGLHRNDRAQVGDDERLRSLRFGPVAWTPGASHSEVFRLTGLHPSRAQLGMKYYVRATNEPEWVSLSFNSSEDANAFHHTWNTLQLDGYPEVRAERMLSSSGNGKGQSMYSTNKRY